MGSQPAEQVGPNLVDLPLTREWLETTSYAHVGPGKDVDKPRGTEDHPDRNPWWDTPETRYDPDDE